MASMQCVYEQDLNTNTVNGTVFRRGYGVH